MDIFEKREKLLNRQIEMLDGKIERDDEFLSLTEFENWCLNGGLSGFAQVIKDCDINCIKDFAEENKIDIVVKMVSILNKMIDNYGLDFIDKLNKDECIELCKYDDQFFAEVDNYTDAVYLKYIKKV